MCGGKFFKPPGLQTVEQKHNTLRFAKGEEATVTRVGLMSGKGKWRMSQGPESIHDNITVTPRRLKRMERVGGRRPFQYQRLGRAFLYATSSCGGIPLGLVLGHLPEGGQPQWLCATVASSHRASCACNRWPGPQQSDGRLSHTFSAHPLHGPT